MNKITREHRVLLILTTFSFDKLFLIILSFDHFAVLMKKYSDPFKRELKN